MTVRGWVAVVAVTCAGCQGVLGLKAPARVDGAAPDAPADAAPPCVMPAISDDFTSGAICPWGLARGTFAETAGMLTGTVNASSMIATCITTNVMDLPFTPTGVFVQAAVARAADDDYTELRVFGYSGEGATIIESGNTLTLFDNYTSDAIVSVPYDGSQMSWWRLAPVANGVEGFTSTDGRQWTSLGTDTMVSAPLYVRPQIATGCKTCGVQAMASFLHFDVCPP